jgi:Mce-associated membrane protein
LVVLAAGFAAWSGWRWWSAEHDGALSYGRMRDDALRAGGVDIARLITLDYQNVDAGLRGWLDASTGPLRDQLANTQDQSKAQARQAKTSAVGTVAAAAVTELNDRAGTAQLLAFVRIKKTPAGGAATIVPDRYQAGLTLTSTGWKISSLTEIPVSAS